MAGLIEEGMQAGAEAQNPELAAQEQAGMDLNLDTTGEQTGEQADEESQKIYDDYVGNALMMIHGESTRDKFKGYLEKGKDNKVDAVANITLSIMDRLDQSSKQNQKVVPDGVRIHGANEIMGNLIDVAKAEGIFDMTPEEAEASYRTAVGKYMQKAEQEGRINPDALVAAAGELDPGIAEMAAVKGNQAAQMAGGDQPPQGPPPQGPPPQGGMV